MTNGIIMKKYKKPLLIALVVLDVAIITFFLVVSIMLLVTMAKNGGDKTAAITHSSGLVKAILEMPPAASFFAFVFPIFLILAGNIVGLMLFVRKTTKKEPAKLEDLSDEQKEALRQELLKDLQGEKKD